MTDEQRDPAVSEIEQALEEYRLHWRPIGYLASAPESGRKASDPRPKLMSARLIMTFTDGSAAVFEADEPADAEAKIGHAPAARSPVRDFFPADPVAIEAAAGWGEITEVTLRIKGSRENRVRYQEPADDAEKSG